MSESERAGASRASLRDVYAQKALSQIPRLLSLEDRNEFSKTYGCFNREYWLCRTLDFPSAIAQFGVHALALAWATPMPENPYYQEEKVLAWTLAGIDYWMKIQKSDGSFDEFYPNERGWAGPTGFLLYVMCDSYRLLGDRFPASLRGRFFEAVARAGRFLAKYDEPGVLANHHAMAILPIYEAYHLVKDEKIRQGFEVRLEDFLSYCYPEGWCLEYDGTDLGYLSATVSFLSKLQKIYPDERLERVCHRAIEFASYFAYPNGHYAGSMGSRQTLHFYPHGFEVYGGKGVGLASAVAEHLLNGLSQGALVPPEIQEDRYFLYRIPELMQSWIDYSERPSPLPPLPFEREPFARTWAGARMHARKGRDPKGRDYYALINLAKGGVLKLFRTDSGAAVENDCGFLATLDDGKVVTSQWIDAEFQVKAGEMQLPWKPDHDPNAPGALVPTGDQFEISGATHFMVMKLFTPMTMIAFRLFMLAVGWQTKLAYDIKGWIRNLLMTRSGQAPVEFTRRIRFEADAVVVEDEIRRKGPAITRLKLGDEFHVRYVPQSRYFQPQELAMRGHEVPPELLARLNREGRLVLKRKIDVHDGSGPLEWGA
ncbi:MAG: hypothetical protein U0527_06045 [Candidatus Eisenbacteria bacterium]